MPDLPDTIPDVQQDDTHSIHSILLAMALLWMPHSIVDITTILGRLELKTLKGRNFKQTEVQTLIRDLLAKEQIEEDERHPGYFRLIAALRTPCYEALLNTIPSHRVRLSLYTTVGYQPSSYYWSLHSSNATAAVLRHTLLTSKSLPEVKQMMGIISGRMSWDNVISAALLDDFNEISFARILPEVRWDLALDAVSDLNAVWTIKQIPLVDWAFANARKADSVMPEYMSFALAETLMHRGEYKAAREMLKEKDTGGMEVINAYELIQQGKWQDAQALFELGLKKRKIESGNKKNLIPPSLAWLYPLTLLAQSTPAHLELARKFCIAESGKRNPDIDNSWGLWTHFIDVKRGDVEINPHLFKQAEQSCNRIGLNSLWRLLLAAWAGREGMRGAPVNYRKLLSTTAQHQTTRLKQCGFSWLENLATDAINLINEQPVSAVFFIQNKSEYWRELLSTLELLGKSASGQAKGAASIRFIWMLSIDKNGALTGIWPLEQKSGLRGWNKPREISLAKMTSNPHLTSADVKVTACIHADRYNPRNSVLNLPAAIHALVGHPAIVLDTRQDQFIELSEGKPEMEVIQKGDKVTLKITPPLRELPDGYYPDEESKRNAEALRLITLVQDSPQRLRLISFTTEQRRAAQLLSEKVTIPASAKIELQSAMQALTSHFQLQADNLQASREVPVEVDLRAELSPFGDGLILRLVATPLGVDGPRLVPGAGRARLMAQLNGESVGTTRKLKVERANTEAVLDALPFLEECEGDRDHCEWMVPEVDDALAMVEVLPGLPGIAALDWPKGKAVKVITVDMAQLSVRIKTERDWFKVEGEARIDEGLVFTFEALLAASKQSSRFIAMGNGVYAALTRQLKERLADLASVTETDKKGLRIPRLAAAWMDEAMLGINAQSDKECRNTLEKLRNAQELSFPLPKTLQAELRGYQEEGYVWASRLAEAGFGACLADDMGLGKTLQSLALLLNRSEHGPALVIAPTSVCGNWMNEAARFAPSLNMHLYSESDRATLINDAAAYDVVVVSYNLVQLAAEQFAEKNWHTLIADEAQSIKNATTKRTQAVFDLKADFRLALSGTPVENRLSELWSIMRFTNPGLLSTLTRFNERFAIPIERDKNKEAQHTLRRLISPFLLRRTKAQVLQELPPRTELIIKIAPSVEETAHYEALRREAIAEADRAINANLAGQARMNILAQLTRLRRAACDPRIVTPAFPAIGSKVQAFTELAVELVNNGHKALVFSQFVDFLSLLRAALDGAGISYQYLDGATPAAERTRRVGDFQAGKSDLFLISLKAGGFGLNLTAADYVVITDPWWNPAAEDQAMGRAHRMGQLRPVTVYRLVTQGTVEEQIIGLHNDKRALAESILGEGDVVNLPSTAELMSLIKGD
jgi:superfamily II DNA or RNA helicase